MLYNTFQAVLEIVMILLILFRIRDKKVYVDISFISVIMFQVVLMNLVEYKIIGAYCVYFMYWVLVIYCRYNFRETRKETFGYLILTILIGGFVQLLLYHPVLWILKKYCLEENVGIFINAIALMSACVGKPVLRLLNVGNLYILKRHIGIIIFGLCGLGMLSVTLEFRKLGYMSDISGTVILLFIIAIFLSVMAWNSQIRFNMRKQREVEVMYAYNQAYGQLIETVRMRQHDFANHVNAIMGIAYSAVDKEEIIREQQKYGEFIVKENRHNKLLSSGGDATLVGLLYVKILQAEAQGCKVSYRVNIVKTKYKMQMLEMVEIIGILFDNAIEASEKTAGTIYLDIKGKEETREFVIRNQVLDKFENSDIQRLFEKGTSSKGKHRGLGLFRIKELVKKYNLSLIPRCIQRDNNYYLEFAITIK